MEPSIQIPADVKAELARRHKAAASIVRGLIVLTVLLALVSLVGKRFFRHQDNPPLEMALRIAILIFGLGSIALRRTNFSAMRLKDIAALRGPSGLITVLYRTTLQVALLGTAIALLGFIVTLMTGNDFYTYGSSLVALAVLFYCYPTRLSWERTIQTFTQDNLETKPLENQT
jgi:hypothetical protein